MTVRRKSNGSVQWHLKPFRQDHIDISTQVLHAKPSTSQEGQADKLEIKLQVQLSSSFFVQPEHLVKAPQTDTKPVSASFVLGVPMYPLLQCQTCLDAIPCSLVHCTHLTAAGDCLRVVLCRYMMGPLRCCCTTSSTSAYQQPMLTAAPSSRMLVHAESSESSMQLHVKQERACPARRLPPISAGANEGIVQVHPDSLDISVTVMEAVLFKH